MFTLIRLFVIYLFLSSSFAWAAKPIFTIGVFEYQSKEIVEKEFEPLTTYLNKTLPELRFALKVEGADQLRQSVREGSVDALLVNPNLYELIRNENFLYGITATLQRSRNGVSTSSLGGTIFTLNSAISIDSFQQITTDTKIVVPTINHTGAFRIPLYELYKNGVDINELNFHEVQSNKKVIDAVLKGSAEIGFVRTGILEEYVQSKPGVNLEQFKILNNQYLTSYPFQLSTALYPEWPFIILPRVPKEVTNKITSAVFSINKDTLEFQNTSISGFVTALDYHPFEDLLRELKLPPYDYDPFSIAELWERYKFTAIALMGFLITLISSLVLVESNRRKIKIQKEIDDVLLKLPSAFEEMSEADVMQYAMENVENLTGSKISFIHFLDEDSGEIQLVAWSHRTLETYCHVSSYDSHYPIEKAGVWAEAARLRKLVIINDYSQCPLRKGLPTGHAHLDRMVSMPVFDNKKIVMLAGVGNKLSKYTDKDVNTIQLILNEVWRLIKERRAKEEIAEQKVKFQRLLDDLGNEYMVFSHTGRKGVLTYVSAGFEKIFEQPAFKVLNKPWFNSINWSEKSIKKGNASVLELVRKQKVNNELLLSFVTPSGKTKQILVQQNGVYENKKLVSVEGLITDVTDRIQAEMKLKQAASVFESANDGIMICDSKNRFIQVNKRFEQITGYTEAEVLGKNPSILSSGHHDKSHYEKLWHSIQQTGAWEGEIWNRRKNGEVFPERIKISVTKDAKGKIDQYIALISDITFEKEYQASLEKMAHHDALTGLPNRFLLSDRISQAMAVSHRNKTTMAVIFIDLDGFKSVNDKFGHSAGDFLLKEIASRFKGALREVDTIARIGGDEFVVVIADQSNIDEIKFIEQRLLQESTRKVEFEGNALQVSSSIGSVHFDTHDINIDIGSEKLVRLADQAMYKAKSLGKNRVHHHKWVNENSGFNLTEVINNGELELFFQPKYNFDQRVSNSFEGLIRWRHPEKGLLTPYHFLHKIVSSQKNIELTNFVLNKGLEFANSHQEVVNISINIDNSFLLQNDVCNYVASTLKKYPNVEPQHLTLEILESSALTDMKHIIKVIQNIRAQGVKFAIDDFGTGHASLNYLKNLPVDQIKIDQEFIRSIFDEPNSLSIIEAISSMAEAFDLEVIAEGAETEEHLNVLLQLGIRNIQGYAIARPMDETQTLLWINSHSLPSYLYDIKESDLTGKHILKAELSHQAWVNRVERYLRGDESLGKLNLNHLNCQFGKWLTTKGKEFIEAPRLNELDILHQNIHEFVKITIEKHEANAMDKETLDKLISELKLKQTELINLLQT